MASNKPLLETKTSPRTRTEPVPGLETSPRTRSMTRTQESLWGKELRVGSGRLTNCRVIEKGHQLLQTVAQFMVFVTRQPCCPKVRFPLNGFMGTEFCTGSLEVSHSTSTHIIKKAFGHGSWVHIYFNHCMVSVTEALNRPQKGPNMVLNGKFSQPYGQYPKRAQAYVMRCLFYVVIVFFYMNHQLRKIIYLFFLEYTRKIAALRAAFL